MKDIGLTLGWQVTVSIFLGFLAVTALLFLIDFAVIRVAKRSRDYFPRNSMSGIFFSGIVMGIITALILVVSAVVWFIIPSVNKVNYTITGEITSVTNSFKDGTGDVTGSGYAFRIDSTTDVLWTTDARIQAMVGEKVDLVCTREWIARASDYWNCRPGGELGGSLS